MVSTTCILCGADANVIVSDEIAQVKGTEVVLRDIETIKCSACGEEYHLPEAAQHIDDELNLRVREARGLLFPEEIKHIREAGGWTQKQFRNHFNVGEKTVSRWENGAVFHSKETDRHLRQIRNALDTGKLQKEFPDLYAMVPEDKKDTWNLFTLSVDLIGDPIKVNEDYPPGLPIDSQIDKHAFESTFALAA